MNPFLVPSVSDPSSFRESLLLNHTPAGNSFTSASSSVAPPCQAESSPLFRQPNSAFQENTVGPTLSRVNVNQQQVVAASEEKIGKFFEWTALFVHQAIEKVKGCSETQIRLVKRDFSRLKRNLLEDERIVLRFIKSTIADSDPSRIDSFRRGASFLGRPWVFSCLKTLERCHPEFLSFILDGAKGKPLDNSSSEDRSTTAVQQQAIEEKAVSTNGCRGEVTKTQVPQMKVPKRDQFFSMRQLMIVEKSKEGSEPGAGKMMHRQAIQEIQKRASSFIHVWAHFL